MTKMSDEEFARLVIEQDLIELENGKFDSNHYGRFPDRATVERVFSGLSDMVAEKVGPTRSTELYRIRTTNEFFEVYWARGCGEPITLPVDDPLSWLINVGENEAVHLEFIDSDLIAFNLPNELRKAITAKAYADRMWPTEWVIQRLNECLPRSTAEKPVTSLTVIEGGQPWPTR